VASASEPSGLYPPKRHIADIALAALDEVKRLRLAWADDSARLETALHEAQVERDRYRATLEEINAYFVGAWPDDPDSQKRIVRLVRDALASKPPRPPP
jgi:hypothetical protein